MRYSPDHKKATHDSVVAAAAKAFKHKGVAGVGIASLMKEAGLTHGGFYAHFRDKEALVTESVSFAVDESHRLLSALLEREGIEGLLNMYLSKEHRDRPARGCPLPSLSAEVGRSSQSTRAAFASESRALFGILENAVSGTAEERRETAAFVFASMAGAVALARACRGTPMSTFILEATKSRLLAILQ